MVPQGVSLLLFASVPANSRCTLQKLHLALVQFVAAACAFSRFDNLLLAVMYYMSGPGVYSLHMECDSGLTRTQESVRAFSWQQ